MKAVDYLIVGQGLAGSLLAWELLQRGCQVLVVDDGRENASQIAAGLINPITGMRLVKSTDVDVLLPAAKQLYARLEAFFQRQFYFEKPMLRLFRSSTEAEQAAQRLNDPAYQAYLGGLYPPGYRLEGLNAPFGFIIQKQTGYLLTKPLLSSLKAFFIANNCYRLADFDYQELELKPRLSWQDITPTKQVIFCEGYRTKANPWFSWLPFQPVKGEILTLQSDGGLPPDKLLNYGHWLIPLTDKQFRTGATFDRDQLDCQATRAAKSELLAALEQISPPLSQATVTAHQANIRPCTRDKQPFIGLHPRQPQLAIFNGFGAKGSLQIPWYSQGFADSLIHSTPPPSDIQRHYATHFPG